MIKLFMAGFGFTLAAAVVWLIRRDRLHVSHGVGWTLAVVGFALLGFAPAFFDSIATKLGIAYPPMLAVALGFGALVVKILLMDIARTRMEIRYQRLTQKLAILEADICALTKKPPLDD